MLLGVGSGILNSKVNSWMTDSRLLKYQSLLLERPVTKLKVCENLNPATFLPEKKKMKHLITIVLNS